MTENLPVSWEEQMKADARSLLERERPSMSMISFKSGVMSIGDQPVPNNELDCIVIANVSEMCWYSTRYDPNVKAQPDCYALGAVRAEDLVPYKESKNKQAEACVDCEKFEWGSDPNGGRGKACKERRRLALMPANGSAELCLASIPPTSIKNWSNYVVECIATTGMTPAGVITKIKVVPSAKNQFEIKFLMVDRVDPAHLQAISARSAAAMETLLAPYPELEEEAPAEKGKKRKF